MPEAPQIWSFRFEGMAETKPPPGSPPSQPSTAADLDATAVEKLNGEAEMIAQAIQRELGRLLRASATVQAEIRFYEGSIVVAGTITILSWLAPIALAAVSRGLEQGFTQVIEATIQRILQPVLRRLAPHAEPMRAMTVMPQPVSPIPSPALPTPISPPPTEATLPWTRPRYFWLVLVVNAVILFLLLLLQVVLLTLLASGDGRGVRRTWETRRAEALIASGIPLKPPPVTQG